MTETGTVVRSVPLMVEQWSQFPMFDGLRVEANAVVPLGKPGKYNLAVTMGKTPITILPSALNVSSNNDPFNPQQTFTRDGLWNALGFLSKESSNPDAPLFFNWWSSLREFGLRSGSAKCTVVLMQGDRAVAELVSGVVLSRMNWQFFSRRMRTPKTQGKKNLTLATLSAKDGDYRPQVTANGKPMKSYRLVVQNGRLQGLPSMS